jgi:aerobic carbon-monoxide dehydrogenase medium subunit
VIPAPFEYERAESVEQAISLLRQHGEDAKLIAGGHSLLPLMKLRLARPSVLVDIDRLSDLEYIQPTRDGGVRIGALTRMHEVATSDLLHQICPLLAHAAGQVGDPQVRHRATLGGSVAHGDPASDPPSVLLALGASFEAKGPDGERSIRADEFFTSLFETALGPQEVLTEIRVPGRIGRTIGWSYQKFHRRAIDWALVGVAAVVERDDGGIGSARVALTNMGLTPLRATAVEEALAGSDGSPESLRAAAEHAPEGTSPPEDTNGSAEYRRELSKVLVRRALEEAMAGAARTM